LTEKKRSINITLKRLFKWYLPIIALILGMMLAYCWYLSIRIEKRFSGRRWSIPSKIYSDITILYPGQKINLALFNEKLRRLGYREAAHRPENKGELRVSTSLMEIYLHDFKISSRYKEGIPVQIRFDDNRITSIINSNTGLPLSILELEPEEIMLFFGPNRERRQLVSIDQVPLHVIHAVLAAEDHRFYEHKGLDPRGILRAIYTDLRHGSIRQGGSTITQQLAKNYFLTPKRSLIRKLKELFMSLTMEMMYKKNEILEIYLNEIYMGQKGSEAINGIGEASIFYFGKPVDKLSLAEAATLGGLIRGPNHYSPYVDKDRCKKRRNVVLKAMYEQGWISDEELKTTLPLPVTAVGYAFYGKKAPYFMDYLSDQLTALYSPQDLSSLGLTVYTTLDTQVQMAAENALNKGLDALEKSNPALSRTDPQKKLQGAVIVMQPKTGYVVAMVGGRNYSESQFNRIAQAHRQPGSAFKPFVYLTGLDKFTPASTLSNKPKSYEIDGKEWTPQNYTPMMEECVTVREALAKSINLATVDLAMQVGIDHIVNTARSLGFSTTMKPYPSIALGSFEVIPLELARAYCPFAADGVLPFPLALKEVLDEHGNILEQRHMSIKEVTTPAKAFIMSSLLQSVVEKGTASSLKEMGITFPVAAKTGTTNDYRDAWFVGYTPDILALIWVGFDDSAPIYATGSKAALPIWADLMNALPQYVSGEWFRMSPGVVRGMLCSESGQTAMDDRCPHPVEEYFLADHVPKGYCPIHDDGNSFGRIINGIKNFFNTF
jgi:penicillin-binding protein 1B